MSGRRRGVAGGGATGLRWARGALLALALAGCAGPQVDRRDAARAPAEDRVLRTRIEFVDRGLRAVPDAIVEQPPGERATYRHIGFDDPLELSFHAVPGRLAGLPERFYRIWLKRRHAWLEAGTQGDFAFSLAAIEGLLAARAAAYAAHPGDGDFRVAPADTRFVRLTLSAGSPFLYPYGDREAGFVERDTRDLFALLYVDRPCRISGAIRTNDGEYRHELAFDRAGLHWLHVRRTGERHALVTPRAPAGPLSVYVRYHVDP
ncbi:MAG: hypothetical protein JNK22_06170 [Rhodocyclaceae bacterium]|nr:hypothetical protein [Rhodocyclaceae bacterium]